MHPTSRRHGSAGLQVLVTGASGFLGRHVVKALLEAGHSVRAQVRTPPAASASPRAAGSPVQFVVADLLTHSDLRSLCAGIDAVVHLAVEMKGNPQQLLDSACRGTQRLLEAVDAGSTRVLLVSSFAVYDWRRVGPVLAETSPLLPADSAGLAGPYAAAKLAQERVARRLCADRGIALAVARPATVWGRGQWGLDTVGPAGGGTQWVVAPRRLLQLTYVENCADALVAGLLPQAAGRTFNIEDGQGVEAGAFAAAVAPGLPPRGVPAWVLRAAQAAGWPFGVAARAGISLPGLLIPARSSARFPFARVADGPLRTVLGWRPPFDFPEALRRAMAPTEPLP